MKKAMFLSLMVTCWMLGCESAKQSTPNAEGENGMFHKANTHQLSAREYRVDPPDEIVIKAPKITELDGVRQKVRPDGKISLNMVGEVYVVGMTPSEISELLKKMVTKYFEQPEIKVEVIANSKFYYVFGQGVARQGRYAYTGQDTVITALAEAGLSETGWPEQVRVSRPAKEGTPQERATAVVDFKHIFQTGDLSQNYLLEEGDIIEIPYSPLSAWDAKTRKVLGPLTGTAGAVSAGQQVAQPGGSRVQ